MTDTTIGTRRAQAATSATPVLPVTPVAMVLIGVSVVIKAWAVSGSWFYEDDLYFLSSVARGDNDLDWYLSRHNVHFMPLSFVLVTLAGWVGGFAWWPAALQIVAMYAAGALACWWMLKRVFGANPRILLPLTFYLFSPFLNPAVMWWAVAINVVAAQAPLFVLIGAHVEYLRTRRRRWLVLAAAMLLLMSGVYVKSLVVLPVLGLFTLCYATAGRSVVRRLREAVTRWWPAWTLYTVVGLLVAWVYVTEGETAAPAHGSVDVSGMFESLFLRNLAPGLIGGPWSWADMGGFPRHIANPSDFAAALSLAAVLGAIGWAIHRWHGAWLPLAFLAPPVAVTFAALTSLRSSEFSTLVALEPKYWADLLPYAVLALGVIAMAVPGLPEARRRRNDAAPDVPATIVVGLAALYVVSSLTSTISYVKPWHTDFPARQFITGAVERADEAGRTQVVADISAPQSVVLGTLYPYNTPNYLFAPAPGRIEGVDAGVDLRMLSPWGEAVIARAKTEDEVGLSEGRCITNSGEIELEAETFDYPFWVTLTATFDERSTVFVSAGRAGHTLQVPSGRHRLTFRTEGAFDTISVSTGSGETMCPETLRIGPDLEVAP